MDLFEHFRCYFPVVFDVCAKSCSDAEVFVFDVDSVDVFGFVDCSGSCFSGFVSVLVVVDCFEQRNNFGFCFFVWEG